MKPHSHKTPYYKRAFLLAALLLITQTTAYSTTPSTPTLHQISHQKIHFSLITFHTTSHHLIIADQPKGPGSKWQNAAAAAKHHKGIAAINAGFFTPTGKPLGIIIANGKKRGSYNHSSLGSGIFYSTKNKAKITRRSAWKKLAKKPPTHLLQSGPMLLENNKPVKGLSTKNPRPRSFIASNGNNHWLIGHASQATLSQLANALKTIKIPNIKITTALNLDGGRSSDLWASSSVISGPIQVRPFWNKPVRNFLILKNN